MRPQLLIALAATTAWAGLSGLCGAAEHLEVHFGEGYAEGDITGQRFGLVGGEWETTGPQYSVEPSPEGQLVLRISRHGGAHAHVALATPLPTEDPGIYMAVDAYRVNARSRALWAPLAAPGSTLMGAGLSVRGDGVVEIITHWNHQRHTTAFTMEPGKWHRFELEVDGDAHTLSAFVQVEGQPGRTPLAEKLPWTTKNQAVRFFRIGQPDGGSESITYTNNLILRSGVTFPFTLPLTPAP